MRSSVWLLATLGWIAPLEAEPGSTRSWCDALSDAPGLLYESKDNPWVQRIEFSGRFHYQAAYVDGKDVRGEKFNDTYDEYRRVRLAAELEFLEVLKAEVSSNLTEDRRFRDTPPRDLDWGHQDFNKLTLELDIDQLFDLQALDQVELTYGRMKLPVGEELHQSSRKLLTVMRSSLSEQIGFEDSRPTGALLALGKGDWDLDLGVFSSDDDAEGLASWNAGLIYYLSLAWEPNDFRIVFDQVINDPSGDDFGAGYAWVSSLSAAYDGGRWGMIVNGAYGNNGSAEHGKLLARRRGDFYGAMAMPWLWIVEDRVQWVARFEWIRSEQSQGLRLGSRYIRGHHDNPAIDVDGGRGDEIRSLYTGLNFPICGDHAKIMVGMDHTWLKARQGDLSASTYLIAFRSYF